MKTAENRIHSGFFERTALAGGGVSLLIGILGLLGWILNLPLLASLHKGYIPIASSTCILFIVQGALLILYIQMPSKASKWPFVSLAASTSMVGLLVLATHFARFDMGLEALIFTSGHKFGPVVTNRMSPLTGLLFGLSGASLLLLLYRGSKAANSHHVSGIAAVVTAVGLTMSLCYSYGSPLLYGSTIIPVALPTSLGFMFLGGGLLTAAGGGGFILRPLARSSVRSMLLRTFMPLGFLAVVVPDILEHSIIRPNTILGATLSILLFGIVTLGVVVRTAKKVEGAVNAAEAERKLAEELIRLRLRLLEFSDSHSLDELLQKTLDEVSVLTKSPIGFYHFVDDDQKMLTLQAWSTRTVEEFCRADAKGQHYGIAQAGVWVDCVYSGEPVIHNDYMNLPHRKGLPEGHAPVVRELVVPILRSGRIVAILGIGNKPEDYTAKDVEVVSYLADIAFEINERKRSEEALRESERRYRRLHESITDAFVVVDMSGGIVEFNRAFLEMTGYRQEELLRLGIADITPAPWHEVDSRLVEEEILPLGHSGVYEKELIHGDGRVFPVELRVFIIREDDGTPKGMWSIIRDISERKQSERRMRASEERLTLALAASRMGVWEWDVRTGEVFWSSECHEIFGVKEFGGNLESFTSRVHPEDLPNMRMRLALALEERSLYRDEFRSIRPDGEVRWIGGLGRAEYGVDDEPLRMVGITQDITERKYAEQEHLRVEAQLRQAQKMEALGTLAGGIAHDFNNILGIIVGYTEMARWDTARDSPIQSSLEEVYKAAQRAKDLVRQILAFSRRNEQERQPVQVGLIAKEALKMLRASLPSTIEMKTEVTSKAIVLSDPTQVHQVLMNLCTNAAHAMRDEEGVLEVSLTDVALGPESTDLHPRLLPGPFVRLTVTDTGHGIDPSILHRIFDPFFTTKGPGAGTGLGLSVVHGIVESHGGAIEVESPPGGKTTFRVFLPVLENASVPEKRKPAPLPRGRERVLVVDDEPELAMVTKKMLERIGYQVECGTDGMEAIEVFRQHAEDRPFDLVITDMTMPRMTGAELAVELFKLRPNLPVLLCTGFSERIDAERAASLGIKGLLMKPLLLEKLALAVRTALDEKKI